MLHFFILEEENTWFYVGKSLNHYLYEKSTKISFLDGECSSNWCCVTENHY